MTNFTLVRPCPKCPFRTDIPGYLRRARAQEIAVCQAPAYTYSVRWMNLANGHEETCIVGSDLCDALLLLSEQTANPGIRNACMERSPMPPRCAHAKLGQQGKALAGGNQ